jgi:hypothetical protein
MIFGRGANPADNLPPHKIQRLTGNGDDRAKN